MSKHLIDWDWYSNGKRIYYNQTRELKAVNCRTFEPLNHVWARDNASIIQRDKVLRSADRNTFVVLNELYAKDKATVFYTEGTIKDADAETFVAFDADDGCGLRSYAKDKNNVYHRVLTIGKPMVVRSADASTFRAVGRGYGVDNQSVFYESTRLKGADPSTWQVLRGGLYSRDKNSVYFGAQLVSGADVRSFEVLPGYHFACDNLNYFSHHEAITQAEYNQYLKKHFVFIGSIAEGVVTDARGRLIDGLMISDATRDQGIEFKILCEKILYAPNAQVDEPPVVGETVRLISRYRSCDLSHWIGRKWIWFFQSMTDPDARRIRPILNWSDFSPLDDLGSVLALVDRLAAGSSK